MLCYAVKSTKPMLTHMRACVETHVASGTDAAPVQMFHLVVVGAPFTMYWMHLEVCDSTTLRQLDIFLRSVWLESFDHMSCFNIDGIRYKSPTNTDFADNSKETMNHTLGSLVAPGQSFSYEYDFGSTTYLRLQVVDVWTRASEDPDINILARNQPPDWRCRVCGKPATAIEPTSFGITLDAFYCDACAEKTDDPDCLAMLENSPRLGLG